jgi:hypothetical protein
MAVFVYLQDGHLVQAENATTARFEQVALNSAAMQPLFEAVLTLYAGTAAIGQFLAATVAGFFIPDGPALKHWQEPQPAAAVDSSDTASEGPYTPDIPE